MNGQRLYCKHRQRWFDFLSSESDITEVNFWQPGAKSFHAFQPGELFVFRLKSPRDKIGGFGVLSNSSILPLQIAWESFGRSNGTASYGDLRTSIARYRVGEEVGPATNIGCRILVEPVFFPAHLWMDLPSSWSKNIVGGKRYSTDVADGLDLWNRLQDVAQGWSATTAPGFSEPTVRYGSPTLITPRLGQGAFRIAVTEHMVANAQYQRAKFCQRLMRLTFALRPKADRISSQTEFFSGRTSTAFSMRAMQRPMPTTISLLAKRSKRCSIMEKNTADCTVRR